MASPGGKRTGFFVATSHTSTFDRMITRPSPGQTSVELLLLGANRRLPRMAARDAGRAWADHPDRCFLVLDKLACTTLLL